MSARIKGLHRNIMLNAELLVGAGKFSVGSHYLLPLFECAFGHQ